MGSLSQELSQKTVMFGLKLWEVLGIVIGAFFMVILFFLALWLSSKKKKRKNTSQVQIPRVVKEIPVDLSRKIVPSKGSGYPLNSVLEDKAAIQKELVVIVQDIATTFDKADKRYEGQRNGRSRQKAKKDEGNVEMVNGGDQASLEKGSSDENKRGHHPSADRGSSASGGDSQLAKSPGGTSSPTTVISVPEVSHLGWGHWYTLRELEIATDCFSDSKVLGEGGYGIVYLGELPDGTRIAVKNLLNNRGQAEKEFKVEVEAIGRVRHKNLVRLVGYCMEGSQRMLVYEYIDNGNLAQWLHGPLGRNAPLSWDTRMKIIIGTAKGLAYLHEGLEPKVVHRDVKSSNILIDSHWNPKVSDFGLAKLLGAENSHVTTRVMGTFGYVAPEYALTGMLTEKSDIYSYGVLVMELVTGRVPVDYGRPPGEVNLVDWLKTMIGGRQFDEVADPKMESKPSPRALKRALLVALRCVDPDAQKRPKMGHVVHMLETDDGAPREERKNAVRPRNSSNQGIPPDSSYTAAARRGNTLSQAGHNGNDWESEDSRAVNSRAKWRYES